MWLPPRLPVGHTPGGAGSRGRRGSPRSSGVRAFGPGGTGTCRPQAPVCPEVAWPPEEPASCVRAPSAPLLGRCSLSTCCVPGGVLGAGPAAACRGPPCPHRTDVLERGTPWGLHPPRGTFRVSGHHSSGLLATRAPPRLSSISPPLSTALTLGRHARPGSCMSSGTVSAPESYFHRVLSG